MTSSPDLTIRPPSPETTDLERRVLAHERVLQALIAYMARSEPRFIDHLRWKFVEPMSMVRREHDYRDAHDYAEEFIRAVMLLGETPSPRMPEPEPHVDQKKMMERARNSKGSEALGATPDRVQLRQRSGVWEVRVDGVFMGDYHRRESAIAAVALAKLAL